MEGRHTTLRLEAQLLEEPLGLSSLVLGLHGLFQLGADLLLLGGILEVLLGDGDGCLQLKAVAGGHEVRVVDELDKGLDAAAASNLLLAHRLGDLEGGALHTGDQGKAKLFVAGRITIVKV